MQNVLSVSGGKDSTAMLLLAVERQMPNLSAVFADTGNEHDLTYEYIYQLQAKIGIQIQWVRADFSERMKKRAAYVDVKWREQGIPSEICNRAIEILSTPTGIPFLDLCIMKGRFPASQSQFCTAELKVEPIARHVIRPFLDSGYDVTSVQGVRKSESKRRSQYVERELFDTMTNGSSLWIYRPILEWSVDDVFAINKKHGIEPNPLYRMGSDRVGCMPCIHAKKNELLSMSARFPEHIDKIRDWEKIVGEACKRQHATFFLMDHVKGESIDDAVLWSKTSRGIKNLDLFRNEPQDGCVSSYGLCE